MAPYFKYLTDEQKEYISDVSCPVIDSRDAKEWRIYFDEQKYGLPDLSGSEKQINWARDIRWHLLLTDKNNLVLHCQMSAKWWIPLSQ